MQHFAHVHYASEEGSEVLLGHQLKITSKLNVAFEFRYRSEGILEEARKLVWTRMCATLDDVRRY